MIREGWLDSHRIDALDAHAERFFLRLCLKADDFGRFHGSEQMLKSSLYPMKEDIRATDMSRCLAACEKAGLVRCYEVDGKRLIEITRFDQRMRSKVSKFPDPSEGKIVVVGRASGTCPSHDGHLPVICPTHDGLREGKRREEKGSRKEENQSVGSEAAASPLDVFWKSYPQSGRMRSGRGKVEKEWSKIPAAQRPSLDVIVDALERFKADKAWTKENGQFVPAADRWIRERRWESAPAPGLSFNGQQGDLIP